LRCEPSFRAHKLEMVYSQVGNLYDIISICLPHQLILEIIQQEPIPMVLCGPSQRISERTFQMGQ